MIIIVLTIGIATIISLFSRKNGKMKETKKSKGNTKQVEDFADKDFIPMNNSLVLKSDPLKLDSLKTDSLKKIE